MSFRLVDDIARSEHGLIMLMGKGGVGKTTMVSYRHQSGEIKGFDVHLTTSILLHISVQRLNGSLKNRKSAGSTPHDETFERYRQHVLETKGKGIWTAGKTAARRGLTFSPCTEEIAVSWAFSRVIREAGKRFVVMDTRHLPGIRYYCWMLPGLITARLQ